MKEPRKTRSGFNPLCYFVSFAVQPLVDLHVARAGADAPHVFRQAFAVNVTAARFDPRGTRKLVS